MGANASYHQYEPLRVPQNWGTEEKKLVLQLTDVLDDIFSWRNRLRFEDMHLTFRNRIVGTEGQVTQLEISNGQISAEVSSAQIYRASSEAVLLAALAAHDPVVDMAVGLLWYDTTNRLMKRCTVVSPLTWEVLSTDSLHTSFIDILENRIDIGSTGEINIGAGGAVNIEASGEINIEADGAVNVASGGTVSVASGGDIEIYSGADINVNSGGNLNVLSGGDMHVASGGDLEVDASGNLNVNSGANLNVKSGGDIEIESGGDINVASGGNMTIASGGYLNLSAASGIKIGTNPFSVGGTNLLLNSRNMAQYANNTGTGTTVAQSDENEPYQRTTPAADKNVSTYSIDGSINSACFVVPMVVGKVYTLSAEVRPQTSMDVAFYAGKGRQAVVSGVWTRISYTYTYSNHVRVVGLTGYTNGVYIDSKNWKIEASPIATEWSPAPSDPASGVVTSHVTIEDDSIEIASGGSLNVTAPTTLSITAGATNATAIGIKNTGDYFLTAGHLTPASAPFRVKMDGSVVATKIQQEYSQSYWDLADASYPAEFPVYIPSGYTIDTVTFTFVTGKYRAFAKAASTPSTTYTSTPDTDYSGGPSTNATGSGGTESTGSQSLTTATSGSSHKHSTNVQYTPGTFTSGNASAGHYHSVDAHSHTGPSHTHTLSSHYHGLNAHKHTLSSHTHGLTYGIYEKSTLATSCALKIGATTIGTYSPNPASPVEIKSYLSAGWNTVVVQPNNDARIAAYLLVKLTPS